MASDFWVCGHGIDDVSSCSNIIRPNDKFCSECGAKVSRHSPVRDVHRLATETTHVAERRLGSAAGETEFSFANQINQNFQRLMRCIDPTPVLIFELSACFGLGVEDISDIKSHQTEDDKNCCLLEILKSQPASVVENVLKIFERNSQKHVASLLSGKSSYGDLPMSEEHWETLRNSSFELRKFLNPIGGLLDSLFSLGTFQTNDCGRVRSRVGMNEMASAVIRILMRKRDKAFDEFLCALRYTQQSHVVYILTKDGEPPMSDDHLAIIRGKKDILVRNIYVPGCTLLGCLTAKGVLSDEDGQWIRSITTTTEQADRLVDVLLRKPDSAFHKFIQSLNESEHEHVAKELLYGPLEAKAKPQFEKSLTAEQQDVAENELIAGINENMNFKQTFHQNGVNLFAGKGCIAIYLSFNTIKAVDFVERLYRTGAFQKLFIRSFSSLLVKLGIRLCDLKIDESEFERYRNNLRNSTLMKTEHLRAIRSAADEIVKKLESTNEVLQLLTLSKLRAQYILNESDKKRALLEVLCCLSDRFFGKFIDVLEQTDQQQLSENIKRLVELVPEHTTLAYQLREKTEELTSEIMEEENVEKKLTQMRGEFQQDQNEHNDYLAIDQNKLETQVHSPLPYEMVQLVLLKAAKTLHYNYQVRLLPRADVTAVTILSTVCKEWQDVLTYDKLARKHLRRCLWKKVQRPVILLKAVILIRNALKKEPLEPSDADQMALKSVCVCRNWWKILSKSIASSRRQLKSLFRTDPQLLVRLHEDDAGFDVDDEVDPREDLFPAATSVDHATESESETPLPTCTSERLLMKSSNRKVSSPSHERRHQLQAADFAFQSVPLNQSTNGRREVRGVTQADHKIFILYSSVGAIIEVFSDRSPFERLEPIDIRKLKDPRDIVACSETLQLFAGGDRGAIWRVNVKSHDVQNFIKTHENGVRSMSLSSDRLLVTPVRGNALYGYSITNAERLLYVVLLEPEFGEIYHAIESSERTFFVSHCNKHLDTNSCKVSKINSRGQLIASSGRQIALAPCHLSLDSIGRLLVAGWDSCRVLLLNQKLTFERVLLEYDDDKHWPYRLNYNRKTNQLVVGFEFNRTVNVYNWK